MKLKEWAAFWIVGLSWGTSFLGIKLVLNELGPFALVGYRLLIGLLGLTLVVAVTRPKFPRQAKPWLALGLVGLTNVAIPFTLTSWGEMTIDSGVASILNSSVPLYTAVMAHFLVADDRLTLQKVAGLLIGFGGVVVLVWRDVHNLGAGGFWAQGAVLLSAVLYAVSAIIVRRYVTGVSPIVQSFIQVLVAAITIWLMVGLVESPVKVPHLPITWAALVWLGVFGSCLAYVMYFYLIHNVGPTRATQVSYVFPVMGILSGTLFLGERFDLRLALGAALVIASILIVDRAEARQHSAP